MELFVASSERELRCWNLQQLGWGLWHACCQDRHRSCRAEQTPISGAEWVGGSIDCERRKVILIAKLCKCLRYLEIVVSMGEDTWRYHAFTLSALLNVRRTGFKMIQICKQWSGPVEFPEPSLMWCSVGLVMSLVSMDLLTTCNTSDLVPPIGPFLQTLEMSWIVLPWFG